MMRLPIEQAAAILDEGLPIGPRRSPCVCGGERHEHAGRNRTGSCSRTRCRKYRANIAYDLAYKALDAQAADLWRTLHDAQRREREAHRKLYPKAPGHWSVGPSDTTTCAKAIEFRNRPPHEYEDDNGVCAVVWCREEADHDNHADPLVLAPTDDRAAIAGTMLHEQITEKMRVLYPWRKYKMRVRIKGLDREYEIDWYDPITGEVTDVKTVGKARWEMLRDGPDDDMWGQPALYGLAAEDEGLPVRTLKLAIYNRDSGHDETHVRAYDRAFAEKYRDKLLGHVQALDLGIPLPRERSGPSTDVICARYCPFRITCWGMDKAEAVGQSPESYTIVGPGPHGQNPEPDPSVVWAIEQKVAASEATSAAKKLTDQSKALLEGIEPGRYGEFEGYLVPTPGGTEDHKADAAQLRQFYDMPENLRPPLEALPVPQRRKSYYVQWKKARRATLEREARENGVLDKKDPEPVSDPAPDKETDDA